MIVPRPRETTLAIAREGFFIHLPSVGLLYPQVHLQRQKRITLPVLEPLAIRHPVLHSTGGPSGSGIESLFANVRSRHRFDRIECEQIDRHLAGAVGSPIAVLMIVPDFMLAPP